MKHSKIVFAMCSLLTVYSMTGIQAQEPPVPGEGKAVVAVAALAAVTLVLADFAAMNDGDDMVLTPPQTTTMRSYAQNSIATQYASLSMGDRAKLCRIIYLRPDLFSREITKFSNDQKLLAGLTTHEIGDFNAAISAIRNGNALTNPQISMIQNLKSKIVAFPGAFTQDLLPLTQYATINPKLFAPSDLDDFRKASMVAAGLTASDVTALREIANRNTTTLSLSDVKVVRLFASRSGIGSLDAVDSFVAASLIVVVNDNSRMFSPTLMVAFNRSAQKNQAVQYYIVTSKFNENRLQKERRMNSSYNEQRGVGSDRPLGNQKTPAERRAAPEVMQNR